MQERSVIDYRAYLLSENEHIAERIEFEAEDDERAMEHAANMSTVMTSSSGNAHDAWADFHI